MAYSVQTVGTLADVATRVGVSKATVSRVLNHKPGSASDDTRQRILQAARELNYAPNPQFRILGRRKTSGERSTGNLGLLLVSADPQSFASDPYTSRLFWGLEREAQAQQYHLIVSTVDERATEYLPRVVSDRLVDGVLIHMGMNADLIARIHALMPVVLVNGMAEEPGVSSLMPDETACMQHALDYLRTLGHRRVTFFGIDDAPPHAVHHPLRAAAFRHLALEGPQRLTEARLVVLPRRDKSLEETAVDQLTAWRASGKMPTALICPTDGFALAFLNAAARLGIAVPRDLSIVGIDDTVACEYVRPRLTSMRQPFEAMGAAAVQTLLQQLRRPETATVGVAQLFDVQLVERDSCAASVGKASSIKPRATAPAVC